MFPDQASDRTLPLSLSDERCWRKNRRKVRRIVCPPVGRWEGDRRALDAMRSEVGREEDWWSRVHLDIANRLDRNLGIRKLCKSTIESLRRPDGRQESYGHQFEGMTRLHDRLADNGLDFALALHHIYDEMIELGNNMERNRKNWKQVGASAERKTHDAEQFVEKVRRRRVFFCMQQVLNGWS